MDVFQTFLIVAGSIAAFVVFWVFVVFLTSWVSGWSKLATVYPGRRPFNETCWRMQSGRFRWGMGYNGILNVCADAQALHLSVLFLFRPGNPPLSIPWEDITGRRRGLGVELRCRRAESVPIRISTRLAGALEQASEGMWQFERN